MSSDINCPKRAWCKRGVDHPGNCARKASRRDVARMLGGSLTPAERELWNRLAGK
jgi:hypothetical protein